MIASFANKQFNVTGKQIRTFQGFSYDSKLLTEKQDSGVGKPLTIIKGEDLSTFKISIPLSVEFGLSPLAEFESWEEIKKKAIPSLFILGSKPFGSGKYLLNSLSMTDTLISETGMLLSCMLDLGFEEHVSQGSKKSSSNVTATTASLSTKFLVEDKYNIGGYTPDEKSQLKRTVDTSRMSSGK